MNDLINGSRITMADSVAGLIRWQLRHLNLSDDEWGAIEQLFAAAEGRLNTFTFLDPTDNLLMWSEDWTKPQWSSDPMLQLSVGQQDPLGGSNAIQITNASQTIQQVVQSTSAPSGFQYCFSVYVRSDVPSPVQLEIGQQLLVPVSVGPVWKRVTATSTPGGPNTGVRFGLQLSAGANILVFGAQVEAQASAGPYKKTTDWSGIYTETRFDSDFLQRSTDSKNHNSCIVNLIARAT